MTIRTKNALYAGGLVVMAGFFAVFPFLFSKGQGHNHTLSNSPLPPTMVMRGAYVNSGSKDIGVDPQWQRGKDILSTVTPEQLEEFRAERKAARASS
jgi:hypothetical protein